MPIKIAVCDDSPEDIRLLSESLYACDPSVELAAYTAGRPLLDDVLDGSCSADIVFLDIYMPGFDGIQTARKLREQNKDVKIVFLSSSGEHYPEAYEVFAFNYLVKPLDRERLRAVLEQAVRELGKDRARKLRFEYKSTAYRVDCRDILLHRKHEPSASVPYGGRWHPAMLWEAGGHPARAARQTLRALPPELRGECLRNHSNAGQSRPHRAVGHRDLEKIHKATKEQYFVYGFSQMGRGERP